MALQLSLATLGGAPALARAVLDAAAATRLDDAIAGEDLFSYLRRTGVAASFDHARYQRLVGMANDFKEGDAALGLAAPDDATRARARHLLAETRLGDLAAHPLHPDRLDTLLRGHLDPQAAARTASWTLGELSRFLLTAGEEEIKAIRDGLSSDAIACVVRLLSNDELIAVGKKLFDPLPGSRIGARGYLGARIQPNSPTDDPEDIRWQVFDGFAYAVGDVVLGTNPVSSEAASVAAVQAALREIVETFGLGDVLPWCVLAHIDVQAAVEAAQPGSTALWFQSLAGTDEALATFDLTQEKLLAHAASRRGRYGIYFETGQGADATNGHGAGFDMVAHEARNYGLARVLRAAVGRAQAAAGRPVAPWVHLNDVAGFIGPEVFRSREQLVRCCLEDIVMGKLHGLTLGLDVCSTLHMDVSLDDLDWCLDQIVPANPAYLMALPTKNDPMLGYLTTAFQDHVRLRQRFGYRVDDAMWAFYQRLGVIDGGGRPTRHFGQPAWVFLQYQRARGDDRPEATVLAEARERMARVRARGVPLAEGHGERPYDLEPALDQEIRRLYADAKQSIWAEWDPAFVATLPAVVPLATTSTDRRDYILHPPSGELLEERSSRAVRALAAELDGDVQIVASDGLNAHAMMDDGHLHPYLAALRALLADNQRRLCPSLLVVRGGRVRVGYRIGEALFAGPDARDGDATRPRSVVHLIGERPGSGHHTFSAYLTTLPAGRWAEGGVDHDVTQVVSGIADTALPPAEAARATLRLING